MNKEIKKLTKQEKEQIDNKLVVIFATALGSIMLLLYLMNWFRGTGGFVATARTLTYIILAGGIVLTVIFGIISKKALETNQEDRAEKYKNWKHVSLAAAISAFFIYPTQLIDYVFRFIAFCLSGIKLAAAAQSVAWANSKIIEFINYRIAFFGHNIGTRIIIVMILIAITTITLFVYYGIYLNKCHKAAVNKGAKKAK